MPPSGAIATITEPGCGRSGLLDGYRDGQPGRRAEEQRLLRRETVDGRVDGSVVDGSHLVDEVAVEGRRPEFARPARADAVDDDLAGGVAGVGRPGRVRADDPHGARAHIFEEAVRPR